MIGQFRYGYRRTPEEFFAAVGACGWETERSGTVILCFQREYYGSVEIACRHVGNYGLGTRMFWTNFKPKENDDRCWFRPGDLLWDGTRIPQGFG